MKSLEQVIKHVAEKNGMLFVLATPSEENMRGETEKVLWLDIQQDGTFNAVASGYYITYHVKMHLMDDQEWDEEGEVANARKNEMLGLAFRCFKQINYELETETIMRVTQAPSWQVLYNSMDRNKIDIMLDLTIEDQTISQC